MSEDAAIQGGMCEAAQDRESQDMRDMRKSLRLEMVRLLRKEPEFKAEQKKLAQSIGVDSLALSEVIDLNTKTFSSFCHLRDGGMHRGGRGKVITLHPHLQYR